MINGIINVYKEKGYTSFDVVAKLRGIVSQKKIGHTGTLDPDAEGVLPVCFGKATKVCDLLTDKDKEYKTVLLLGKDTDTQDISGKVLHEAEVMVTKEQVKEAIVSFVGDYAQVPPMYSALKVNGKKLCDLAREGISIERKARNVTIYDIEIESINLPRVEMKVHCSKGTYIRTLCKDIGDYLGCYGCMESLQRTRVAEFKIEDAVYIDDIKTYFQDPKRFNEILYPIDSVFEKYPALYGKSKADILLKNGNKISVDLLQEINADIFDKEDTFRIYNSEKRFVGLYQYKKETMEIKPLKMFLE